MTRGSTNETIRIPAQTRRLGRRSANLATSAATAQDSVETPTQRLCALVYVEKQLREQVHEHLTSRLHTFWAPCYAVDLVALLGHTRRANRLVLWRDWCLTVVLLLDMALVAGPIFERRPVGYGVVTLVVLAVPAVRHVMVWRKKTVRSVLKDIRSYARRQWKRSAVQTSAMIAVLAALVVSVVSRPVGRLCVLLVLGGFLLAWLIVAGFTVLAYLLASGVKSNADKVPDDADRLPKSVVDRAARVARGNLLVYAHDRANGPLGPFVGAGHRLHRWSEPLVDITIGRTDDQGVRQEPKTVDVADVHGRLKRSVEDLKLPKVRCEHRLYVDGRWLAGTGATAGLLVDPPLGPPVTSVDEGALLRRVTEPLEYQRGYLSIQITDWGGEVVVTMFVRAVLERELLHLECAVHALPVVSWRTRTVDEDEDEDGFQRYLIGRAPERRERRVDLVCSPAAALWYGVSACSRIYWPTLFGAARHCARFVLTPLLLRLATQRHRRQRGRGVAFDFGAETSLRERLALGQIMHYNEFEDVLAHLARLQTRLTKSFADYLTACDIDLQDFVQKSANVVNHIQQNIFNNLNAGAMAFGAQSTATGTVNAPSAGQSPAGSGPSAQGNS